MDVRTFLAEFGHIVNAPGGVKRLREMVLQLAVQGKLVEQDSTDEPASETIKKIKFDKSKIIKHERAPKNKILPKISNSERPFHLAKGWEFVRLGEITNKIGSGSTPRGGNKTYDTVGIPFLRSQNIWNNGLKLDDVAYISIATHEKMSNTKVFPKDILLNITGASLGRCALVPDDFIDANVSQHVTIIRPTNFKTREYLHLCILSPYCQKMIWGRQVGMAREGLSKKVLELFEIPFPPLEEQKRIVAKVDELMVLCDRLEAQQQKRSKLTRLTRTATLSALANAQSPHELKTAWNRVRENLGILFEGPEDVDELKKTIVSLSLKGNLTKRGPGSAGISLKNAANELTKLKQTDGYPKIKGLLEVEKIPYALPVNWRWARLHQLAKVVDPNPSHRMPKYVSNGIPFISTENFAENDRIDFRIGKQVSNAVLSEHIIRYDIPEGAFVLSRIGTIGKTRHLPTTRNYCVSHALVIISSITTEFNEYFLRLSVSADDTLKQALDGVKSIGVPDLGMGKIRNFLLPLPPLEEQHRIVSKVKSLMTLCDTLESQLKKARSISEKLAQSAVATITGTQLEEKDTMKAPKTELVTRLKLVKNPSITEQAPLCAILARHNSELSAKALWNHSGLAIDDFYRQLRTEMVKGWIDEPEKADMRVMAEKEAAP